MFYYLIGIVFQEEEERKKKLEEDEENKFDYGSLMADSKARKKGGKYNGFGLGTKKPGAALNSGIK